MTSISDTEVVNAPGGLVELGYSQITTSVTLGTSSGVVISPISVVCDGSPILVEFFAVMTTVGSGAGSYGITQLMVDGSVAGRMTQSYTASAIGEIHFGSSYGSQRLTPSAGVHTFGINGYRSSVASSQINAGNGSGDGYPPAFIRISKILQASQLLVTQANAPVVTQLPVNPVQNQEVYLYSTYGYTKQRYIGAAWEILEDNRKVYFQAHTNAVLGTTGGATMAFNRTIINQGNCFNTSTYLFTAPFAGDYKFRTQVQKRNAGVLQLYWIINGSTTNNRGVYTDIGNDSLGPNMEVILNLAANATVGVYYTLSAGDVYGSAQEYFTYFQGEYLK